MIRIRYLYNWKSCTIECNYPEEAIKIIRRLEKKGCFVLGWTCYDPEDNEVINESV